MVFTAHTKTTQYGFQALNPNGGFGKVPGRAALQAVITPPCRESDFFFSLFFQPSAERGWCNSLCLTCSRCHLSCRRYESLCTCPWRGWAWTSRCSGRSRTESCKHTQTNHVLVSIRFICIGILSPRFHWSRFCDLLCSLLPGAYFTAGLKAEVVIMDVLLRFAPYLILSSTVNLNGQWERRHRSVLTRFMSLDLWADTSTSLEHLRLCGEVW